MHGVVEAFFVQIDRWIENKTKHSLISESIA